VTEDIRARRFRRLWSLAASCAFVGVTSATVGPPLVACLPCHDVAARPLPLDCVSTSSFAGELHFTDDASFLAFLTDRCLGPDAGAAARTLVDGVDFSTEAVVVARGVRKGAARCIEERSVDTVAVCDDGVRIAFDDVITNAEPCAGDWTIAFVMPRTELRAAVADDDDAVEATF
jgi:hypothetical protein